MARIQWGVWVLVGSVMGTPTVDIARAQTVTVQGAQVEIRGPLPRDGNGAVNVTQMHEMVTAHFNAGARDVQFRGTDLSEAEAHQLFLSTDRNQNLLSRLGTAMSVDGLERTVTFRGTVIGDIRVQRDEDRSLRLRGEGVNLDGLSDAERRELVQKLNQQAGFDRVRLAGLESRSDKGLVKADSRSGNRGGGGNSGSGSVNSGPGSLQSESGRGGDNSPGIDHESRRSANSQNDIRRENRREDRRNDRGMLRGLDRADEAASEHGLQGRDNARDRMAVTGNRMERPERAQRPERSERPQRPERPERPERHERSGRG